MTAITIEGAGYPIRKVFSDNFVFNIPNYQRPYAWTTEETEQLLIDLIDALEDESTDINKIPPYFLGNVVLIKPIDKSESEVVDGQQRLTTLTILFAVLKKLLKDDALTNSLTKYICQPEDIFEATPERPRLKLRERDRDFFEEYIQKANGIERLQKIHSDSLSDSQRNIVENTRLLLDRIAAELPEESQKLRLTQFLLQRCYLVIVHTPDFDSAYKIFSVLNDRGLDLSITDILKADVIGKLSQYKEQEEKYTRKWEDLEQLLGRKDFTELFSHIRMIYAQNKLESSVLKSFRTYVLELEENKVPCYLIDRVIEPYAKALENIKNCTFVSTINSSKINQLFRWLQRIGHFDWIAPGILYLTKYRHEPEQLLKFFTYLERLAAGLMILKANIDKRIKRYADIIKVIESNGNLFAYYSPLQLESEEEQEICDRLNGDIYNTYKARNARLYILLRLDSAISDGNPNYDGYRKITIEHILPQNPKFDSQWLNWFSIEEKEKYLHCLGNLILLSRQKNSSANNYDFQSKKEKYFNSPVSTFALTVQVLKEQEWTPEIVKTRQIHLVKTLKLIWQLNDIKEDNFVEPLPSSPDNYEDNSYEEMSHNFSQFCEYIYGEPVRLIFWQKQNDKNQFNMLFRERRRGWYFQMLLINKSENWHPEYRVYEPFLHLLESKHEWTKLTKSATLEDWYALDEIFINTMIFPGSKVIFAGSDLVGEEVADEAMEKFGFYVPDEDMLPVLFFEAPNLGVSLISYFRHPDGFAKENMVSDRNVNGCEVFESLIEAQQRLDQKLSYYTNEA